MPLLLLSLGVGAVPAFVSTSINLVRRLVHCPRQTSVASILGTAGPVPLSPPRRYGNTTATCLRHRYSPPLLSLPGAGAQRQHPHCSRRDTQGRRGDLAARAGEVITRLPETGWPAGLFARRDAMILTLAATGLTYTQIAARRICDVTADPVADALHVDAVDRIAAIPPGLVAAGSSPTRVHRRRMEVLGFSDRYFSTHLLATCMDTGDGSELTGQDGRIDPADRRPLLTPIDRWGHTPLTATPLTARAVADIIAAHLSGQAPRHIRLPLRRSTENNSLTKQATDIESLGDD